MTHRKLFGAGLSAVLALAALAPWSGSAAEKDEGSVAYPAADIIITLNRRDPVAFSHARHLAADSTKKVSERNGFACSNCHPVPFERVSKGPIGMEVPHETGGCAECHNGRKRTDGMPTAFAATTRCLTCHKPPA